MRLTEHFLKQAIPGASVQHAVFPEVATYSIDSRTLVAGDIFVALEGAQVDGHEFVADAVRKGAAGIIIAAHKKECLKNISLEFLVKKLVVIVPDTRLALIQLAIAWRQQFTYPVIAVTGSVGKTSTKEIIAHIAHTHGMRYLASVGNQNSFIGLALNILKMQPEYEMAVFEVGIDKRGEMSQKVEMVRPSIAIITGIGHAHMEGLGSIADIAQEKRAIFSLFKEDNIGIINGDQTVLAQVSYAHPVVKCGAKTTNQIQARKIKVTSTQTTFVLKLYGQRHKVTLNSAHVASIFNALPAAAAMYLLRVPADVIVHAIQNPVIVSGRFEQRSLKSGRGILINDCYNANPESMKAALLALQKIETRAQKIAVLGDMLELGVNSAFWHRQLGRFLRKVPTLKKVVLVGSMVEWTKKTLPVGVQVEHVPTWKEAVQKLDEQLTQDSLVLVKGSHGIGLGNLVNEMT